ncbi:hypothetical protein FJ251_01280 [bacterium]|nr:hypothetical protein [bacterium]
MLRQLAIAVTMFIVASTASAMTLTADGFTAPGVASPPAQRDRLGLVYDGSFEFGPCREDGSPYTTGSAWRCTTNTTCNWILDPTPIWGYPAYDGVLAAWLGGFCGYPNSNSFCQEIFIDGSPLSWQWMGYVNSACGTASVSVNGVTVWSHVMQMSEHTYGSWNSASSSWGGVDLEPYCAQGVTLCINWVACPDGASNDNMLIDYVVIERAECSTGVAARRSMSTVKSQY